MTRRSATLVIVIGVLLCACEALIGANFDDPPVFDTDASINDNGEPDGSEGSLDSGDASAFLRGCSWCLTHPQNNGACWDFDCVDAQADALHNGWRSAVTDGGDLDLVSGHLESSKPYAARSKIAGVVGQAYLTAGPFLLDGGQETSFEFDLQPIGSCTGNVAVNLGQINLGTASGTVTLGVDLYIDSMTGNLLGHLTCPGCNCDGCSDVSTTNAVLHKLTSPPIQDWARLKVGISRPSTTTTVTISIDEGGGPNIGWQQTVLTMSPYKLSVDVGLQKTDTGQIDSCAFAYDNVVVDVLQ